jgi:hypothetical protein
MLALVVQAGHRTDATRIVFETWVVEARGLGSLLIEHMKVGVEVQTPRPENTPRGGFGPRNEVLILSRESDGRSEKT